MTPGYHTKAESLQVAILEDNAKFYVQMQLLFHTFQCLNECLSELSATEM